MSEEEEKKKEGGGGQTRVTVAIIVQCLQKNSPTMKNCTFCCHNGKH